MIELIDHTKLFSVEKMRGAGEGHETEQLLKLQMQFRKGGGMHMRRERSDLNFIEKQYLLN